MLVQPILPSGVRTSSGVSQVIETDSYTKAQVLLDITAVAGTTPTLDVKIECSPDNSRWFSYATFSQKTTIGKDKITLSDIALYMRISYTIGGTTPSFTFQVDVILNR